MVGAVKWMPVVVAVGLALALGPGAAMAQADKAVAGFAPHRAIYEIKLDSATPGSSVAEMNGRMVYELTGSACEGFTQNMRFITDMINQDGSSQLNDLRNSSWEEISGKRLRFNTSQYQNDRLAEQSQGDAARKTNEAPVSVELTKPTRKGVSLPANVYFPIQHSMALLKAARAGARIFTADLYDGSEKGEKVYATTSAIGKRIEPGAGAAPTNSKNADKLKGLASWPIAISYFEPGSDKKDALPTYELSFRFYENGVSDALRIDYGDFAIRGELTDMTLLPETTCH